MNLFQPRRVVRLLPLLCACAANGSPAPVPAPSEPAPSALAPAASVPASVPASAPSASTPPLSDPPASAAPAARVALATSVESAAIARALESVRASSIRADLRFVAADELEGRDTPSQGLRKAARFLRARLMRLGFTPAGDEGGWFAHYRMTRTALREEGTHATIEREGAATELAFGRDYFFYPSGAATLDRSGEVVFAGTGTAEEVASLDLAGRFALVYETPSPDGRRRRGQASREREKVLKARGAIGAIVVRDPETEDPDWAERVAAFAGAAREGRLDVESPRDQEAWPQVIVSAETARRLTGAGPRPALGRALGASFRDERTVEQAEAYELENVAGLWPGSDPKLAHEVLVVSAHYDHIGLESGDVLDRINNGADDNGSGTCGMLAIAEALQAYGPMRRSVLLLWVSGEEKGLKGSYAWTKHPVLPEGERVVCDLNIDMIGRNAPDQLMITPTSKHPAYNFLTRMAEKAAPLEGFPSLGDCDDYWARSDQMNFSENLGVPVAFLFSGEHEDYHKPSDEADKIDYDKIARVARLVVRMLDGLQEDELER